jgi:hypothetical protein
LYRDPRTPVTPGTPNANMYGPPNQSRSFKMLQAVTNTMEEDSDESEIEQRRVDHQPMVEQNAIFSRPLDNDRNFTNNVKAQGKFKIYSML